MPEYLHMSPNFGRNKIIPLLLVLPVVAFAMVIFTAEKTDPEMNNVASATTVPTPQPTITFNDQTIRVDVAKTENQRRQGLSGRNPLGENEGLLFIFPEDSRPQFWMKDMKFDIDIIWINDGVISQIDAHIPAPMDENEQLPLYVPNGPIDYVLEMNAGSSERYGFEVGDTVTLPNL